MFLMHPSFLSVIIPQPRGFAAKHSILILLTKNTFSKQNKRNIIDKMFFRDILALVIISINHPCKVGNIARN